MRLPIPRNRLVGLTLLGVLLTGLTATGLAMPALLTNPPTLPDAIAHVGVHDGPIGSVLSGDSGARGVGGVSPSSSRVTSGGSTPVAIGGPTTTTPNGQGYLDDDANHHRGAERDDD